MRIPKIRGIIDRRILVNFRVNVDVLAKVCPDPFRPQTVNGFGVAGICLIRLKSIRPSLFPAFVGISSENAAHRIAVEWTLNGNVKTGVYIPRRDTSSVLNAIAGGRIFPGVHHRAYFTTNESSPRFSVSMKSKDGSANVHVAGRTTDALPQDSVFNSVKECSAFFEQGSLGYSPGSMEGDFDGLELRTNNWQVQPMEITEVESSFFNDEIRFPEGSIHFDNALLMQGIDHEWHSREAICCHGV